MGDRYDRDSRPRLHTPNLHRTRLQYFCHKRVRRMQRVLYCYVLFDVTRRYLQFSIRTINA